MARQSESMEICHTVCMTCFQTGPTLICKGMYIPFTCRRSPCAGVAAAQAHHGDRELRQIGICFDPFVWRWCHVGHDKALDVGVYRITRGVIKTAQLVVPVHSDEGVLRAPEKCSGMHLRGYVFLHVVEGTAVNFGRDEGPAHTLEKQVCALLYNLAECDVLDSSVASAARNSG